MAALSCFDLNVGYNGKAILSNINLSLDAGSMSVMIGANGSGKSTLLRSLAGIEKPLSGKILYHDEPIDSMTAHCLAHRRAFVNTSRRGGGALSVYEAVAIGLTPQIGRLGILSAGDRARVQDALRQTGMERLSNRRLGTLSDGERQKAMIARALVQDTTIIILDEPTAFLDVAARIESMALLRRLADKGHCILFSTHDISPALQRADNALIVAEDTVKQYGVAELRPEKMMNVFPGLEYCSDIQDFR